MAEGWLRSFGGALEIFSAGTHPEAVNPLAVEVMAEVEIDISHHKLNHVDEYLDKRIDYVVTVCDNAKEACPVFPGEVMSIHHSFEDPANVSTGAEAQVEARGSKEEKLPVYRKVRDEIGVFCEDLYRDLAE